MTPPSQDNIQAIVPVVSPFTGDVIATLSPWVRWIIGGLVMAIMFTFGILRNHEGRIGNNEQQLIDHKDVQKQSDADMRERLTRIENNQIRLMELMGNGNGRR